MIDISNYSVKFSFIEIFIPLLSLVIYQKNVCNGKIIVFILDGHRRVTYDF